MYRLLIFSALLGTALLTALPEVSAAWLKEHSLHDDHGPSFLQQRRSFTHSLGEPAHHVFESMSNKTDKYDQPKQLDLKVNVLAREQPNQGEVALSHDVSTYGFSFFFVGNTQGYSTALDTTLQKFKAAQNTLEYRSARDWANSNLFPYVADMITSNVQGVDRVELIGSNLWQNNAELVWDDKVGKKFIAERKGKWIEYNQPQWRKSKRLNAATVFRNVLDMTCYGYPCPENRDKKDAPHTIVCPKPAKDPECTDDLCCKPAPNIFQWTYAKAMEYCGGDGVDDAEENNLNPQMQSCSIDYAQTAQSFPALHVDHFHALTLELDFGFMGIMDMKSKVLSDQPVYFYKGDERQGCPPKYRVSRCIQGRRPS
uniref:C-type lectin domain-containing protein n=1 Tax=Chromera velia CCMP2878 TaxID=1169474 RepID=A0A0G4HDZ2_9ALVE|eukprot:Cvel_6484.t1-p1 / transcript=Cvel_6484.t1 / gene=Cvel_6484 / organism=Chromera_velia_CCMP2878 / gene_product=hypothetical protein / transcript_product=hypothetical protein / location=Cvel_scaffold318:29162-30268(+) / protein_length=369 / sequence_SO=supercontig / SO=protein_coding / is_pseudo=false